MTKQPLSVELKLNPHTVLSLLGSLWTHYYGGKKPLLSVIQANLELHRQQRQNLAEVAACVSRLTVPLYHLQHWFLLKLHRNEASAEGLSFPKPAKLASVPIMLNRMTDSTLMLQSGVDYRVKSDTITFTQEPFEHSLISKEQNTAYLWCMNAEFDHDYVHKHFGYVYATPRAPVTHFGAAAREEYQAYKDTINAIADCHVRGTTIAGLSALLAAALGVPVADGQETVLTATSDRRGRFLATTRNIYRIATDAILGASEGTIPSAGTPLVREFAISELRTGQIPSDVTDVRVPAGMAAGAEGKLTPVTSLDVVSCILIRVRKLDRLDGTLLHLIRRVLPPQTGVVFAQLGSSD